MGGQVREVPGKLAGAIMIAVARQGQLLEIVGTLAAIGGFTHLLDRRQQQADEDGDNRDHHQ